MEKRCIECYSVDNRITPLLKPLECLENHTQYICGTCGRCICIEHDPVRGLQRWKFPFKLAEIAKLYLRTADYHREIYLTSKAVTEKQKTILRYMVGINNIG